MTLPAQANIGLTWLRTGEQALAEMLSAIEAAQTEVCLEMYIFTAGPLGIRFRDSLVRARGRGARVRVLIDSLGSIGMPGHFWDPLKQAGGEMRYFNPLALRRFGIRNHRKLLVCDQRTAIIGGFNVAPEYDGDGVTRGWCDLGLKIDSVLAVQLGESFEDMWRRAEFRHKRFVRLRKLGAKKRVISPDGQILFSGPGLGVNALHWALRADLARAREVRMISAYFLPTGRLRRDLGKVVRRGGRVELILPGKSDVAVAQMAGRSLYRRLLRSGVEINEYTPQILHAKLIVADDAVYIGSTNLDHRSLTINYELMVRFENREMADQAREIFADKLAHCRRITQEEWTQSRTFWRRFRNRWAYFILVRIDPWVAQWQWRGLPD